MKKLFLLVGLFSFAQAQGIEANALNGIFQDALMFFTLFGTMSIISFIISKKNARSYELKHSVEDRRAIARERKLVDMFLNSSYVKIKGKATILLEISQLLEDKTINKEEFQILKHNLCVGSKF